MDKFKKYAEILKNFSKDMEMWKACEEDEIADAKEKYTSINRKDGQMISVLDVLTIFVSGFIAAKVCDYVHGLEESEE